MVSFNSYVKLPEGNHNHIDGFINMVYWVHNVCFINHIYGVSVVAKNNGTHGHNVDVHNQNNKSHNSAAKTSCKPNIFVYMIVAWFS